MASNMQSQPVLFNSFPTQDIDIGAKYFNQYGYHGLGIDQIIAESGVAKTTLYRHFNTKVDLIVAVLNNIGEHFRETTREAVDNLAKKPEEKIYCFFDVLGNWFNQESFHGCPFVSAIDGFSDRTNPIFQEAVLHKRLMLAYFAELARTANLQDPDNAADIINLLYEGALTTAKLTGDAKVARAAKTIAQQLLKR